MMDYSNQMANQCYCCQFIFLRNADLLCNKVYLAVSLLSRAHIKHKKHWGFDTVVKTRTCLNLRLVDTRDLICGTINMQEYVYLSSIRSKLNELSIVIISMFEWTVKTLDLKLLTGYKWLGILHRWICNIKMVILL